MTPLLVAGTTPRSSLRLIDTLDDRREIWHLLHRIQPRKRVAYLARCCRAITDALGYGPRVTFERMAARVDASYRCGKADDSLTNEVYGDLLMLACDWRLDLLYVAVELEQLARGHTLAPLACL